jgi:hypothetical protein
MIVGSQGARTSQSRRRSQCTIEGYQGHDPNVSQEVRDQLTPRGPREVDVNYGNPNNAHRDPDTGLLSGVAIDLAGCRQSGSTWM